MIAKIFNAHLLGVVALNKDSEKSPVMNLECSAVGAGQALKKQTEVCFSFLTTFAYQA